MLKIGITGASGRMGKEIVKAILEHGDNARLSAAIAHSQSALLGQDAGLISGVERQDVALVAEIDNTVFDVLIDFSQVAPSQAYLNYCLRNKLPIVIGTTGFDAAQKQSIEDASKEIPIVFAPNMSVGVNLSFYLLQVAASVIGNNTDIEIVEAHHRHKVDAPSGTALKMGEVIADTLGRDLSQCAIYGREGYTGARDSQTIGFSTVRAGSIVGDHTVMFADEGERLEITHKAASRMTFASGAVRAALWLQQQPVGLYDMQDVLGLKALSQSLPG